MSFTKNAKFIKLLNIEDITFQNDLIKLVDNKASLETVISFFADKLKEVQEDLDEKDRLEDLNENLEDKIEKLENEIKYLKGRVGKL